MPYGIDQAVWNRLPLDDRAQIIAEATAPPPPPPPPAPPPPPPPPAPPPPPPPPSGPSAEQIAAADAAGRAAAAAANALLAGGGSSEMAAAAQAAGAPPEVVQAILDTNIPSLAGVVVGSTPPPVPEDVDSLDDDPDAEAGDEPTAADYALFSAEADDVDAGNRTLASTSHPPPGTLIGWPYTGTHAKAFNVAGGSDNWQSENAVDVWLYPGTALTACAAGVISPGGYGYGLSSSGGRFAGWRLHLITDDGKAFFYTHCSSLLAKQGARVSAGQLIARSGIANGVPHLHFAARPPYNPLAFYKAAFSVKDRNPVADPVIGGVGVQGGLPNFDVNDAGVQSAWLELMRVHGLTLPAAAAHIRDARQQLGAAVS
jgi:murein DD-endopeptidase MepM/ murein hydrolase activator NlpD